VTYETRFLLWRAESAPVMVRILALEDKVQDSGLTPDERAELERMEAEWQRLLSEFLRDTGGDRPC
jgi:hypothetical protein